MRQEDPRTFRWPMADIKALWPLVFSLTLRRSNSYLIHVQPSPYLQYCLYQLLMDSNNSRLFIVSGALFVEVLTTLWNCYAVWSLPLRNEVSSPMPLNVRYRYTFIACFIFITTAGTAVSVTLLALSWQGRDFWLRYLLLALLLWSMLREVGSVPTYPRFGFLTGRSLSF